MKNSRATASVSYSWKTQLTKQYLQINNLRWKSSGILTHGEQLLFFSHSVVSHSLWTHGLQHARLLCPSLFRSICSDSQRTCSNSESGLRSSGNNCYRIDCGYHQALKCTNTATQSCWEAGLREHGCNRCFIFHSELIETVKNWNIQLKPSRDPNLLTAGHHVFLII